MKALTVLFLALCLASVDAGVRFAVPEGTSLKKTFEVKSRATLTEMKYRLDGQPMPKSYTEGQQIAHRLPAPKPGRGFRATYFFPCGVHARGNLIYKHQTVSNAAWKSVKRFSKVNVVILLPSSLVFVTSRAADRYDQLHHRGGTLGL